MTFVPQFDAQGYLIYSSSFDLSYLTIFIENRFNSLEPQGDYLNAFRKKIVSKTGIVLFQSNTKCVYFTVTNLLYFNSILTLMRF